MSQSLLLAGLLWSIAAPGPKEVPKKDTAPLTILGTWEVESCKLAGKEDLDYQGDSWEFTSDGRINYLTKGKAAKSQSYKIDDSKKPSEFDHIVAGKGGMPKTFKGIYKIDGDTLTICIDFGGNRATKFESAAGTETMLLKLKHVEKKKE